MTRSDTRNKEVALGRIKRLASSGLPLEPFVRSIFELINDAVPNSPNRSLHVGEGRSDAYIWSTPEVGANISLNNRYFVNSSPEISGMKFRIDMHTLQHVLPSKTIWSHRDVFLPEFDRAEGFNETYRPLGWHHSLAVTFCEAYSYIGYCGIWRTVDQKPFGHEDVTFLKAAAPHVAHGLKAAKLLVERPTLDDGFAPFAGWGSGVILLDQSGHPIAMDSSARQIFHQIGVFDGIGSDAFAARSIRSALDYVMLTLRQIFREPEGGSFNGSAPVYRLYHHWTGVVLKLRGVRMASTDGREYTSVLLERGETAAARQRRVQFRWGLSDREAEVLALIGQGKTGPEISIILNISHDTARKHTSRILEKLGVETRAAAATVAREAMVPEIS